MHQEKKKKEVGLRNPLKAQMEVLYSFSCFSFFANNIHKVKVHCITKEGVFPSPTTESVLCIVGTLSDLIVFLLR